MIKVPEKSPIRFAGGGKKRREASASGTVMRELIADITGTAAGHKLQNGEYRKHPIEPEWRCPRGFSRRIIERENYTMEYLTPDRLQDHRVILQLHGGGYIGPMKNIYRRFAVLYSRALQRGRVLTIDYRVAPEHPFPAALEDACDAYQWLLAHCPAERIIIAGDSAGGGLALALCHYLKDRGAALPSGLILMSPWTDLTTSGESYKTNYERDPLFGRTEDSMLFDTDYIGDADPKNPYLSPVFGEFDGFPPMLIQVGSYEMLLSDSLTVEEKVRQAGGKVRCTVYEGMFHVFQMARGMLPESRYAWKEIREYLDNNRNLFQR